MQNLVDTLQQVMGRLTALVDLTLLSDAAGFAVAAGGVTTLPGGRLVNLADANLTEARLLVDGTTTGGTIAVELMNVGTGAVIASVNIGSGLVAGAWAPVHAPQNSDTTLTARVQGDGSASQTLYLVAVQFRTSFTL